MPIGNNYCGVGPARGVEFVFYIGLVSQANTKVLQNLPTIEEGDFKVSKDDGDWDNLATLPTVSPELSPPSGKRVKVTLSAAEMEGDNIVVLASDASGNEWCDRMIDIQTGPGAAQAVLLAAVDDAIAPTTTEFETEDIVEETATHYYGRAIIFVTGALSRQAATIEAYSLNGGRGHFTVSPLTEAPAGGDRFVIV